jgi:Immunity protein 49
MRSYPHQPDEHILAERYPERLQFQREWDQRHIDRNFVHNANSHTVAADGWVELAQYAYAFEEPTELIHTYLTNATNRFKQALATGQMIGQTTRDANWIAIGIITNETPNYYNAIDATDQPHQTKQQAAFLLVDTLLAIINNQPQQAQQHATELTNNLNSPSCHPQTRKYFTGTDNIIHAILNHDQHTLNEAITTRTTANTKHFSKGDETLNPQGLLDLTLTGLAKLAHQHHLTTPTTPYIANELIK